MTTLRTQLEKFEGRKHEAYPDPLTGGRPWTIGCGHTGPEVVPGLVWTDEQIDSAFSDDICEAFDACCDNFPWFPRLNAPRQAVLIGMVFQMGIRGTLKFVNAIAHMRDQRWPQAAGEMLASDWAKQTPKRVKALARQMETGEWQT